MAHLDSFAGKTILIIGTCGIKKKYLWEKIGSLGLDVVVVDKEKNWADPYVDHWIIVDPTHHDSVLAKIDEFLNDRQGMKIDGVFNLCEDEVIITAKVTEHLGCIGIPLEIVNQLKNKYSFREFCRQNGIPAPQHHWIRAQEDIEHVMENFHFPVVIKPAYGKSSSYVIKAANQRELLDTYLFLQKNLSVETEPSLMAGKDLMVEEYISGDEVDVEILLQDSKIKFMSITDNVPTREPFFVEVGEVIPSRLSPERQEKIIKVATKMIQKTGILNGCFHFEAKSTPENEVVPIELNLRMGGCDVYIYMKEVWGVDFIEYGLKIALGISFDTIQKPAKPLHYVFTETFMIDHPGVVVRSDYDEALERKDYFKRIYLSKKIGDQVKTPPESYDHLGWIVVSGDTFDKAKRNLEDAKRYVHCEIAPL